MTFHIYCRVSYVPGDRAQSNDAQETLVLRPYAISKGFKDEEILVHKDKATSGSLPFEKRAAGGPMWASLKPGDHIGVTFIDRLFRDDREFINAWEAADKLGVTIHSVCDLNGALAPDNAMAWFIIRIKSLLAEMERRQIIERTRLGMAIRKAKGMPVSNFPGFGKKFKRIGKDWMCVDSPEEVELMKRMLKWSEPPYNKSYGDIANHMRVNKAFRWKIAAKKGAQKLPNGRIVNPANRILVPVEWSESMIKRAIDHAKKLREEEPDDGDTTTGNGPVDKLPC